ncbi:hypothetical protein FKG96_09925 [Olivibacter sp. LS-1]|uniref:hypothetical protein n=1 Tax=Olivibacter sp. LS-1 TaxID=2592345 RepID=UPI0011EB71D9|nr:hypothetical protein [Olivibacter sp. LS-1]QEL01111.1 hypothetical protein FKG96_09925 [Olivibacter sp. LS-1]
MTALQILSEMERQDRIRKAPSMPPNYIIATKFKDSSANELTKSIIKFIQLNGGQAERINTMGRVVDKRKKFKDVLGFTRTIGSVEWQKGTGTKGSADISATIKGRSVKIEVKFGKDVQSEAQRQYQESVERSGGIYYIAKDFESFYRWYNEQFS